ncbi:MAG TPA: GAF domain-containing protein [Pseudolysinimonas sp.]
MTSRVIHALVRRVLEAMVDSSVERHGRLPMPTDAPIVHSVGPDPDRILMIGGGTVAGIGVASHELGLGGQLARRITWMTGRGVDLELASEYTLTFAQARSRVALYDLERFDAVVLMMGAREAVGWAPVHEWRSGLEDLLDTLTPVPRVFVVAVPDFTAHVALPRIIQRETVRRIGLYNAEARLVSEEAPGVRFVPFIPQETTGFRPFGSTAIYERWADTIAPAIAVGLDPVAHSLHPRGHTDEQVRQQALDDLDVVGSAPDRRIDQIARMARDLLGASGASVTFLDHDRQLVKSAIGVSADDMVRTESFCNTTISKSRLFVVEDAANDPRFVHHPWVVGPEHVRFYAGYPLEAPEGVRVGALCVVDTKPRRFSRAEASLLRDLALQVQDVLWSRADSRRRAS